MSKSRATAGKALAWGALALGLAFFAVYVAQQESEPRRSMQSDIPASSTKKERTLARNSPSNTQVAREMDERHLGELSAEYLASATPPLSDPLHDDEVQPHPITEERIRMAEQHALFQHITESLKLKDFRLARRLIDRYETQFSSEGESESGWDADRRGFASILDCLETGGERAREQAEDFIEQERLSPLRRHVRRVCLDGHDF